MSTIDVYEGLSVLTLTGANITTGFTGSVSFFQAGAAGVVGLQLWATITTDAGSSITTVTFSVETSNDNIAWAPTLAIPHEGGGTQTLQPAFGSLSTGTTYGRKITVPPTFIGASKYVRLRAKANAGGMGTDAIGVLATGW